MTVSAFLFSKIKAQHSITFAEFMQIALYAPQGGYYTVGLQHFGKDFTTAPQLTPLFAYTLANQCIDILRSLTHPIIFEFGAGSGQLCVDLLLRLEQLGSLPVEYHILEVSGALQAQQRQLIKDVIPHLASKVIWLDTWPTDAFEGVILANEVLDAMPVHRFLQTQEGLFEMGVSLNNNGILQEVLLPCTNTRLSEQVRACVPSNIYPYQSEINLYLEDWLAHCGRMLTKGLMLVLDYGFPRHEYYHPDRYEGTLMCHFQHRAHTNPYLHLGDQDITAHVDFTHVAEAGVAAGFQVSGFTSQASFLLANGLLSLLSDDVKPDDLLQQQHAVKTLIQPNEMGELFKVMALTKAWQEPLRGFQMQDRRARL